MAIRQHNFSTFEIPGRTVPGIAGSEFCGNVCMHTGGINVWRKQKEM